MSFIKKLVLVLTLVLTVFLTLACGEEATLKFEKNSFEVTVGESFELKPIITGSESLVEYSFDKEGIVKIENQTVSALAAGDVVITAALKDAKDVKATITVTVKEKVIEHTHAFDKEVVDAKYLATEATCTAKATYYKSCSCGEKGTETFEAGDLAAHVFDKEVVDAKYLATEATCTQKATYYKSCACGEKGTETFEAGDLAAHVFDKEVVDPKYLAEEATTESAAKYYKSCVCGEKGTETFSHGDPLPPTEIKAEKVEILNKIEEALFGDELELEIKVTPENTTDQIEITASDEAVEISDKTLELFTTGKVTITVKCGDAVDSFEIMLYDMVTEVAVEITEYRYNIGDEVPFVVTISPETAKQDYEISFSVDGLLELVDGKLKAVAGGTVEVIVTSKDGNGAEGRKEIQIRDLVSKITVTGQPTMYAEKQQTLTAELEPKFTTLTGVVWSSSDESVATVDETGVVKSLKPGTVVISCTSVDAGKCVGTFEITVNELPVNASATLVDANVATMAEGEKILYKGIEFIVGKTAFANIKDAIEVSTEKVYVAAGDYTEELTIEKSGLTILGPNANVDPVTKNREAEAKFTALITLAENVKDVTFNGLTFAGAAGIRLSNGIDGLEFSYNILDGISVDGVIDGYSDGAAMTEVSNVKFKYNYSNNYKGNRVLRFYGVTNLEAVGNSITCTGSYDFINCISYMAGDVNVSDNTYVNSNQSFIYVKGVKAINAVIENNYMENIANTGLDFRNMLVADASAKFVIRFNTFNNAGCGWCPIRIRTADYSSTNSISVEISYNKFIESYYADGEIANFIENPSLSSQSDPFKKIYVVGRNYYVVKGETFTDLTDVNFTDAAISYEAAFATAEELEQAKKLADITKYVNGAWVGTEAGATVNAEGKDWVYGTDAFATLAEALAAAKSGDGIKFAPGTYEEEIEITVSGIKLFGANHGVDPNLVNRTDETILTKTVKLAADVTDVTISGFVFDLDAYILGPADGGNDNFTFTYNIFTPTNTMKDSSSGQVSFIITNTEKVMKNLNVSYNRFEATGNRTIPVHTRNVIGLKVYANYFAGTYGSFNDCLKLMDDSGFSISGKVVIEANEFIDQSQYTIWAYGIKNAEIHIVGNKFTHCGHGGADDGYLRAPITFVDFITGEGKTTIVIEKNEFTDCDSGVRIQLNGCTEENLAVTIKNNKFFSWVEPEVITKNGKGDLDLMDAEYNFYGQEVSNSCFSGVSSYAKAYENADDVPVYERAESINMTEVKISNKTESIDAYTTYQVELEILPENATNKKVLFVSSDEKVATVDSSGLIATRGNGTVTIKVYGALDDSIYDEFTFTVKEVARIEPSYEGNGVLNIGETLQLKAEVKALENAPTVTYESSDNNVATVDANGLVTAVAKGNVVITLKSGDLTAKVGLTVVDPNEAMSEVLKLLVEGNNGRVFYDEVKYIGYETGFESVPHHVYGSVNDFYAAKLPDTIRNMLSSDAPNYDGRVMKKVEFVVMHDTGSASASSSAKANSNWCTNPGNDGTSWHYTIGNDGIYQQLEDNMVAWHAGDGTGWGETVEWFDSGIAFEGYRPEVTVGDDGYFYINGKKSLVEAPRKSDGSIEKRTNDLGLVCVKGENGNYMFPTTWISDGYNNVICAHGGNLNGIGIETAVNSGSDVYLTWQYMCKFGAGLLIKHNLDVDRFVFHNNFSNKTCPNTMMTNDLVDMFFEMQVLEYTIAKYYSDYEIKFTSLNPEIIDNSGRVVNVPNYTTSVSYTITVTKDGVSESITLSSLVFGKYNY